MKLLKFMMSIESVLSYCSEHCVFSFNFAIFYFISDDKAILFFNMLLLTVTNFINPISALAKYHSFLDRYSTFISQLRNTGTEL